MTHPQLRQCGVSTQRKDRQHKQVQPNEERHYRICIPPRGNKRFQRLHPIHKCSNELVDSIVPLNLVPTEAELGYIRRAANKHIMDVLEDHHSSTIKEMYKRHRYIGIIRFEIPPIRELILCRTPIYPLPALPLNEAKTDEILKVVDTYTSELCIEANSMEGKKMLCKVYLRTYCTLVGGLYQRRDCRSSKGRLDFVEVQPCLFHLEMAVCKLLNWNYWGDDSGRDPCSIAHFIHLTQNHKVKKEGMIYGSRCPKKLTMYYSR